MFRFSDLLFGFRISIASNMTGRCPCNFWVDNSHLLKGRLGAASSHIQPLRGCDASGASAHGLHPWLFIFKAFGLFANVEKWKSPQVEGQKVSELESWEVSCICIVDDFQMLRVE